MRVLSYVGILKTNLFSSRNIFNIIQNKIYMTNLFTLLSFTVLINFASFGQCVNESNVYTFTYNGHFYDVVKENKTWTNAALCANEKGGYLAEITDVAEQNAIFSELTANAGINILNTQNQFGTASIWLGGRDSGTEGEWIWDGDNDGVGQQFWSGASGGTAIGGSYTNWGVSPAEPDNSGGQDYLTIIIKPTATNFGLWNDLISTNPIYSLIEYDDNVGINENPTQNKVQIYPNPINDYLQFVNSSGVGINLIDIFDHTGKKLISATNSELNENRINVSSLNQGVYVAVIQFENGTQVNKKIVK